MRAIALLGVGAPEFRGRARPDRVGTYTGRVLIDLKEAQTLTIQLGKTAVWRRAW